MEYKPEMIAGNAHAYVVRCTHCQDISFCYKNLILRFKPEGFKTFMDSFSQIDFKKSAVSFPDEKKYILVNSYHKDIQLRFTEQEFEDMKDLLSPAVLMLETWDILGKTDA